MNKDHLHFSQRRIEEVAKTRDVIDRARAATAHAPIAYDRLDRPTTGRDFI